MTRAQSLSARPRLALMSCLLALATLFVLLPSSVHAEALQGYGELTRFGSEGSNPGELSETGALALGVDPRDNSVYVLDQLKEEFPEKTTEDIRTFRLNKFVPSPVTGEYSFSASIEFTESSQDASPDGFFGGMPGVDGLAVDPGNDRVYLLVADLREEKDKHDIKTSNTYDGKAVFVAANLYAFSTIENGSKLVPATGENINSEGVLVGPTTFNAQSSASGKALLEPHGITVDPETNEVIVLAHVDDNATPPETDEVHSADDHYVLQRINEKGQLTSRYVDTTNVLNPGQLQSTPTSPAVVSAGGHEHVYVQWDDGLAEIPDEFKSTTPPKAIPYPILGPRPIAAGAGLEENKEEKPKEGRETRLPQGGQLTASEGQLYGLTAGIEREQFSVVRKQGVLALSGATGSLVGWSGSQESTGKGAAENKCVITPAELELPSQVAAGSDGKLFVLAPEFLRKVKETTEPVFEEVFNPETGEFELLEAEEEEITFPPFANAVPLPAVVEFGPGGSGCLQSSAVEGPATVDGKEVKDEEAVRPSSEVKFTSKVKNADATSVEWTIEAEGGGKETVSQSEEELAAAQKLGEPTLTHKFTTIGKYTVAEKIYVDDLAGFLQQPQQSVLENNLLVSPSIVLTRKVNVAGATPNAQFVFSPTTPGAAQIEANEAVQFESNSSDPNGSEAKPLEYSWSFGDGSPETAPSESATATHAYATAGTYTVKLTVKDKIGATSSIEHGVTVVAPSQGCTSNCGGGGGGGGGGTTTTPTSTTPTTTAPIETPKPGTNSGKPTPPTRAQLLAKALKSCKKEPKKKRGTCEATARKKYGPKPKSKGHKKKK
jgi:PKD repeat protein